ncbi:DUF6551 family protein [Streptomyces sp. NPDC021354]|uniref:DUF6551 family protein n=1 Tax=Streptomyces sp. NPDC021354 TaxID=3154793 RepID=UPI0033C26D50
MATTKTAAAKKAVGKQRSKPPQYEPVSVDKRPVYHQKIPVGQLEIDPKLDAQRMFQRQWANKLHKIWNPKVLMAAIVSKRADGRFYLLDGQHSSRVAEEKHGPDFERHCMVYEQLTPAEEAALFLAANRDRKAVRPVDNYRVALTAEDPLVTRINDEVVACGLTVTGSTSVNQIGAVQAVLAVGSKREGLLTQVLTILGDAWMKDRSTWDNMMIRAVGMVLDTETNGEVVQPDRLAKVLGKLPVRFWKTNAVRMTPSGGGSNSRSLPLAENIVTAYNSGLRDRKKMLVSPARATVAGAEESTE